MKSHNDKQPTIHKVFNSISDLYNTLEVNHAIKKLPSVPSRLILIDKLLKRREEIQQANELSQITKLEPVFTRLKQKFLQKLRMSKMNKNKSPTSKPQMSLYQKPLLIGDKRENLYNITKPIEINNNKRFGYNFQHKPVDMNQEIDTNNNANNSPQVNRQNSPKLLTPNNTPILSENVMNNNKRPTVVRMIASFNDHGLVSRKSAINLSVDFDFKPELLAVNSGRLNSITLQIPQDLPRVRSPNSFDGFSRVFNANSKYAKCLEKDLIRFAKGSENNEKLLEIGSPSKSIKLFDSKIKQKLKNLLTEQPFSMKKTKKNEFQAPSLSFKHLKTHSNVYEKTSIKTTSKKGSINGVKSVKDDESYVSFTEMKLVNLYKESMKMKEELENNEKIDNRGSRDANREKMKKYMKKNNNEIIGLVKRKIA